MPVWPLGKWEEANQETIISQLEDEMKNRRFFAFKFFKELSFEKMWEEKTTTSIECQFF